MSLTKRPPRRQTKRSERHSGRPRVQDHHQPSDDTPLSLLRAQIERVEAERHAIEHALMEEKEERCAEAAQLGAMMAHVSKLEAKVRDAEDRADSIRAELQEERRRSGDLEAEAATVRIDLDAARALVTIRSEELEVERMNRRGKEQELLAAKLALEEGRPSQRRASKTSLPPQSDGRETAELRARLDAAHAEGQRLRESLAAFQKRASVIGDGLKEMRELMVQCAALFDDLEERERAIGEIRGRSLRQARALFMRASGTANPVPPPLPQRKVPVEDLSDAAELLEEEVRATLRPKPTSTT